MQLTAKIREKETKSVIKKTRRDGNIPAVLYSPGKAAQTIEISGASFEAAMREIKPGRLATTVFTLDVGGKPVQAIVKDIQYNLVTYQVIHLDFEGLDKATEVKVKVPVECVGMEDCVGIKLGGFLRQVVRSVKVKCLPKDIPQEFIADVRNLGIRQAMRLSDLTMPKGVEPISADEVVVVIAKR